MGNNSSSQNLHGGSPRQWTHSYPREAQFRGPAHHPNHPNHHQQVKVLPERIPGQRLRVTDNGAILQNGGTISGRRQSIGQNGQYYDEEEEVCDRVYRSRSSSHHRPAYASASNLTKLSSKRFGSEPDLRSPNPHSHNDSPAKQRISRGRKKYRAPPPPPEGDGRGPDSSSPDSYHWDNMDQPARRLRLFKTREETKKAPGHQRSVATKDEENKNIAPSDRDWHITESARNGFDNSANINENGRSLSDKEKNSQNQVNDTRQSSKNGDHIRINIGQYPKTSTEHNIKIVVSENDRNGKGNSRENQSNGKLRNTSREEKPLLEPITAIPRVNGIRHQPQTHSPKPVHRSLSTPEFQMELLKVAQRLSPSVALLSRNELSERYDRREDHRKDDLRNEREEFEERGFRESIRREEHWRGRGEFGERELRESIRREEEIRRRGEFDERELKRRELRESVRKDDDRRGRGEFGAREYRDSFRRDEDELGRREFGEKEFRESFIRAEDRRGKGEVGVRDFREEVTRRVDDHRARREFGDEFREEGQRRDEDRHDQSRVNGYRRGRHEHGEKENMRDDNVRANYQAGKVDSGDKEFRDKGNRKEKERPKDKERIENDKRGDNKSDSSGRREPRGKGSDWKRRKGNGREREGQKEEHHQHRDWPRERESRDVRSGPLELRLQGDGSGQESTPAPRSSQPKYEGQKQGKDGRNPPEKHWEIVTPPSVQRPSERDVPTKTFYFGMEQGERDAVERFAASIHRVPPAQTPSGSGGSLCSEVEEENEGSENIALQLRPTLPKKQLEIPRFSPTTAWRLLSALETPAPTNICEEVPVVQEERILRSSRPIAPLPPQQQQHAPRSHDKSGDSGISGDASPGGLHEDSSEAPLASPPMRKTLSPPPHERSLLTAWTPQQDLGEEESSSDGDVDESMHGALAGQPKFSPRAQVFSLSLPRDNRLGLALYSDSSRSKRDSQPSFNSLKKLKRSVSGALNALGTTGKGKDDEKVLDENWLLSRSVPNSLTSGHIKPNHSRASSPSSPDLDVSHRASFTYLASGGHVMYLPDCKSRQDVPDRLYPTNGLRSTGMKSKSCENISTSEMRELDRTPSPDMMIGQERLSRSPDKGRKDSPTGKRGKSRRFTFQSTVRQIERRRISERLSRDAELKERRRLGELEAMRRVEEEFQRKRAPEKANIRHQLRLFNLDEQMFSSLPNGWADSTRAEPDGAASSSPNSSTRAPNGRISPDPASLPANRETCTPQTQILSEYREPRREYRDYRPSRFAEVSQDVMPEKRATVHPPAVFDMPKSSQVYVTPHRQTNGTTPVDVDPALRSSSLDNYRKDFAHGAMRSLASSDSELSQPNTRPHSRQQSRSASPTAERQSPHEPDSSSDEEIDPEGEEVPVPVKNHLSLTAVQPFSLSSKGYRPIAFSLGTKPPLTDAQFVK